MKSLNFKTKILLLVVVPLLLVSASITVLALVQAQQLAARNIESFSDKIFELRRDELKNYTKIAVSSVRRIYSSVDDEVVRQEQAKEILRDLSFGQDGYFFAFDWEGTNLVHPQKPEIEGRNFWDLQDVNGVYVMRSQIENSQLIAGGYTDYVWEKSSLGRDADKISFSMGLEAWQWGIATGLYVDDLEQAVSTVEQEVNQSIKRTLQLVGGFALLFTIVVGAVVARFTLTESALADGKLTELSRKVVIDQERERIRVADSLNRRVNKGLLAAKNRFEALVSEHERSKFVPALTLLEKTMAEVDRISSKLRPGSLDELGLYPAVEAFIDGISSKHSLTIDLKKTVLGERLSAELETTIYRVIEEAVSNTVAHAQASSSAVRIRQTQSLFHLTVRDDGQGFDVPKFLRDKGQKATGITNMRLRVESVGGTFGVFSSVDNGSFTLITVQIPLS